MSETKTGRPRKLEGVKRYTVQLFIDDAEWAKSQPRGLHEIARTALAEHHAANTAARIDDQDGIDPREAAAYMACIPRVYKDRT